MKPTQSRNALPSNRQPGASMSVAFSASGMIHRPNARAAFTLVELLVVIGIIAVLVGMLFPLLSKARVAGESAKCKSNLEQIALGFAEYIADHKGEGWISQVLPAGKAPSGASISLSWAFSYSPSYSGNPAVYTVADGWMSQYLKNINVFVCPTFPVDVTQQNAATTTTQNVTSYAVTYQGTSVPPSGQAARVSQVHNTAETVLAADAATLTNTNPYVAQPPLIKFPTAGLQLPNNTGGATWPHARHNKIANVAWFDGHVSAETLYIYPTDYVQAINAYFSTQALNLMQQQHMGAITPVPQTQNVFTVNVLQSNYYFHLDKVNGNGYTNGVQNP